MATFEHPTADKVLFPSLGGTVLDWLQENACHGPGDSVGLPLHLSDDQLRYLYRLYEVLPGTGRRRFTTAALQLPKSAGKSELAALISLAELLGPVRCDGFDEHGQPVGVPVTSPVVLMFAWSGDQAAEINFDTLKTIAEEGEIADELNITERFIERKDGRGIARSLTRSPSRADGSRATFQVCDEVWRFTELGHHDLWRVLEKNAAKRRVADSWTLAIGTAYLPGQSSVAEELHERARKGNTTNFYFSARFASDHHDLKTQEGREDAIREAGAGSWVDVPRIAAMWEDETFPHSELEQIWLGKVVSSEAGVFPMTCVLERARPSHRPVRKEEVAVGFDGSVSFDSTAFVCTGMRSGFQWVEGLWERPPKSPGWEVNREEVEETWQRLLKDYKVEAALFDQRWWESEVNRWVNSPDGKKANAKIFATEAYSKMSPLIQRYVTAWRDGSVTYSGSRKFTEHLANARKYWPGKNGPDGEPIWVMSKDRANSPKKIDIAMAGCLSWAAYLNAGAGGNVIGSKPGRSPIYMGR